VQYVPVAKIKKPETIGAIAAILSQMSFSGLLFASAW
jgi:hypothetical protein